jgi:heat-inducible transcriptional repressor
VLVRIGSENELPALQSLALVAAGYGLPSRKLGTVSLIGPGAHGLRGRDPHRARGALQLSRFIEDVYEG